MRQYWKRITAVLVLACLLVAAGCRNENAAQDGSVQYTIGVAAYDPDNAEMEMFMNYYRDYIAEGFPVKFYFSGRITSAEEEQAFIRTMKEQGAGGVISFYGNDIGPVLETCAEEEMYYVLASGTLSDEDFAAAEDNPYFLGTIGPRPDAEKQAGADMAAYFTEIGAKKLLLLSGGAAAGNYMHYARVQGMLEALEIPDAEALASAQETAAVQAGDREVTVVPGYFSRDEGRAAVEKALGEGDYDAVLCAYNIDTIVPLLQQREAEVGHSIRAGTVDSFTAANFEIIKQKDAFGNPQIDYIEGKYASMAGPAFAAMCNALNGDLDVVKPDGKAFRLYQGFWNARSPEEYVELYGYTTGIYENAYSCADLMQVIRAFHEDADFDALQALTEAYDIESVKARILSQ